MHSNPRVPKATLQAVRIGMWVFLASLAVLFASSLFGYLAARLYGPDVPRLGALHVPTSLWASTIVLGLGGIFMTLSLRSVRREKQTVFRWQMLAGCVCGFLFLTLQAPALWELLESCRVAETQSSPIAARKVVDENDREYNRARASAPPRQAQLYFFVFSMVVLHALHVFAGLPPLAVTTMRSFQGAYDHEVYDGVLLCVMYWHFLDAVWFVMFAVLLLVG